MDQNNAVIREYSHADRSAVLELLQLNTPIFFSPAESKDLEYYLDHEIEIPLNIPINNTNCTINPYSTVTNGELVKILDECSQLIKQQLSHDRSERFQTFENVITTSTKTVTITAPSLHGDYFTHDCLKRWLKAYWELRKIGYRSILMDSNLDSIGLQSLDHCLSIYLYGSAMKFDTPPLSSNFSKGETHNTGVYYGLINCTKCS